MGRDILWHLEMETQNFRTIELGPEISACLLWKINEKCLNMKPLDTDRPQALAWLAKVYPVMLSRSQQRIAICPSVVLSSFSKYYCSIFGIFIYICNKKIIFFRSVELLNWCYWFKSTTIAQIEDGILNAVHSKRAKTERVYLRSRSTFG